MTHREERGKDGNAKSWMSQEQKELFRWGTHLYMSRLLSKHFSTAGKR